jgi:hypothetical protein
MIRDGHPSNRECASQMMALLATLVVVSRIPSAIASLDPMFNDNCTLTLSTKERIRY